MDESKPLVSVIIPVYNTGSHLRHCLDSVLNQTLREIEIIVVDDGSDDLQTLAILNAYRLQDPRIRLIPKVNGGQSSARNAGLRQAKGSYVAFVDHDDVLNRYMYEILWEASEEGKMEVVECRYRSLSIKDIGKIDLSRRPISKQRYIEIRKDKDFLIENIQIWKRICRIDFLKDSQIEFDDLRWGEDVHLSFKILICAKSVAFIDAELYFHVQHEQNTSLCLGSRIFDVFKAHDFMAEYLEKTNCKKVFEKQFTGRILKDVLFSLSILHQSGEWEQEKDFFIEASRRIRGLSLRRYGCYYSRSKNKLLELIQEGDHEKFSKYQSFRHVRKSLIGRFNKLISRSA